MIASLPMYDFDELRVAHETLWSCIASRLSAHGFSDAPRRLTRSTSERRVWGDSQLLFGQACEYPLARSFANKLQLIATPCYTAPGCEGAKYRSAIVVRRSDPANSLRDLRGRRGVVNDWESNSGMNLLRHAVAPFAVMGRFFGEVKVSGAHRRSMRMIASGEADVAAIDCITFALCQRVEPALTSALRILEWTAASPCLPFVAAIGVEMPVGSLLRAALAQVMVDPALQWVRNELLLAGVDLAPDVHLAEVREHAQRAAGFGYGILN